MKSKFPFFLLLLVMLSAPAAMAQNEKIEVENSISRDEMPSKALNTLDQFWPNLDGIRYYAQTDGDSQTYEAKLEWEGINYSIEFTDSGAVIDVEQLISREDISPEAGAGIDTYLQQEFDRVRITRLQRQYIADDEDGIDDIDFIDDILEKDEEDYKVRYELEVEGKSGSQIGAFELLFNRSGELILRRKIVRRSLDNIW